MKRIFMLLLTLVITAALLPACAMEENPAVPKGNPKINVVATIFPQYDFIRQIAGDRVELTMLLPPGSESHSFEPTPQDIIRIQSCDMFVYGGGESDAWIDSILDSMDTVSMEIVPLLEIVKPVEEEIVEGMEDDHDDDEHAAEYDEHVWTSPQNAMTIVRFLSDKLCGLDSVNASFYTENSIAYLEKLDALDAAFAEAVAAGSRKAMVFGDRFPFRYFADAYGLEYFAAFPGCSTETEPSAATVAFLINKVRDENIPVVFFIEFSTEKMADTICEATGAVKRLLHSCHNITKADFETGIGYLELMAQNVQHIREALQ